MTISHPILMFFARARVKAQLTTHVPPMKQTTIYKQFGLNFSIGGTNSTSPQQSHHLYATGFLSAGYWIIRNQIEITKSKSRHRSLLYPKKTWKGRISIKP